MSLINRFIFLCFAIFVSTSLFMTWQIGAQGGVTDWIDHTHSVIERTRNLLELFLDAETGEQGFLLTGEERYLAPYKQARSLLTQWRQSLQRLTADNSRQQQRLDRLAAVGDIKLTELDETIQLYRDRGSEAARTAVLTDRGKASMDEIRSLLTEMEAEERKLLQQRVLLRRQNARNVMAGAGSSSLLGLMLLFVLSHQQRRRAAEKLLFQRNAQELLIMQTLVERAPMGVVMLDRRMRTVQASRRWLEDVGLTREAVIGKSHYEYFPNLPGHWAGLHRRGLAGEWLSGDEESFFTPDGAQHWVNWQIAPWGDGGETTGGIVIYVDDITDRKRVEHELTVSETRYRGLFEHMNRGIAYCQMIESEGAGAPDFRYLAVNRQFEALTGLSGVTGKRVSELFPRIGELDAELLSAFETVARTGEPRKFESFMHVTGQWNSISAYGPEKGFFVVMFDVIDERKKAEATARQWQRAFEESHFGIALSDAATGRITAMNPAYSRMLGYAADELVGQDIAVLYSEEGLALREAVLWAADSERSHVLLETRHVRKDGTSFPVLIDVTLVRDEAGNAVSHIKVAHDLTELRRAGEALRASEARARTLFENASQGILTTDGEGRIVDANPMVQSLFGYGSAELIGAPVEMLLPESLRGRHVEHRTEYLRQPRARPMGYGIDLLARRKDGTEFPVEISLSHVAESTERPRRWRLSPTSRRGKQADRERESLIASLKVALGGKDRPAARSASQGQEQPGDHGRASGDAGRRDRGRPGRRGDRGEPAASLVPWRGSMNTCTRPRTWIEWPSANTWNNWPMNFPNFMPGSPMSIRIKIAADDIDLPVHQAIPCGLILNELLSNAMKYAFPDGRSGEIAVRFGRLESGEFSLSCQDDGVGMPEGFHWPDSKSLGLRIVGILTSQIDGDPILNRNGGGTMFELKFPGAK